MNDREALAAAVRASDALSESGKTLPEILRTVTRDPDGAIYVAMQRALRVTPRMMSAMRPADRERAVKTALSAMWLDGMRAGYALRREHEGKEKGS